MMSLRVAVAHAEVMITTCGQTVLAKEVGVLQQDLACPVAPGTAGVCISGGAPCVDDVDCQAFAQTCIHPAGVILESLATLRLGGFSLSDGDVGIDCHGAGTRGCQIEGPGEIRTARLYGILVQQGGRYRITQLSLDGNRLGIGSLGVAAPEVKRLMMTLADLTIANSTSFGILLGPPIHASVKGTDITLTDNGSFGILVNNFISANPSPRRDARAKFTRLLATGNSSLGIYADQLTLIDSALATSPLGATDIWSFRKPHLRNSTCNKSVRMIDGVGGSGTWGVCAAD